MRLKIIQADLGRQAGFAFQMRNAQELQKIEVAGLALRIDGHPGRTGGAPVPTARLVIGDREETAYDRLDTSLGRGLTVR